MNQGSKGLGSSTNLAETPKATSAGAPRLETRKESEKEKED